VGNKWRNSPAVRHSGKNAPAIRRRPHKRGRRDLRTSTWQRRAARETAFLAAASSAAYGLPAASDRCDMARAAKGRLLRRFWSPASAEAEMDRR
jgi:hypothetical protein